MGVQLLDKTRKINKLLHITVYQFQTPIRAPSLHKLMETESNRFRLLPNPSGHTRRQAIKS